MLCRQASSRRMHFAAQWAAVRPTHGYNGAGPMFMSLQDNWREMTRVRPTWSRRAVKLVRTVYEALREALAAHRRYESLISKGQPHDAALRDALGSDHSVSKCGTADPRIRLGYGSGEHRRRWWHMSSGCPDVQSETTMSNPIVFALPRNALVHIIQGMRARKQLSYAFRNLEPTKSGCAQLPYGSRAMVSDEPSRT
jgi:hypothetical protein